MSTAEFVQTALTPAELATRPADWWHGVLGVVGLAAAPPLGEQRVPAAVCGTPPLAGGELCEVWRVGLVNDGQPRAATAQHGPVVYRSHAGLTFGAVAIAEGDAHPGGAHGEAAALREATQRAYHALFDVLEITAHRQLVRVWNYLPQINRHVDGEERYRHFNSARRAAFARAGRGANAAAPAATAVGSACGGPLSIFFLAAAAPAIMIENPRQVSAYHYPPQYGRDSPLFSRACLMRDARAAHLFVSGTASIVGHRTVHPGDVTAQAREALMNVSTLIEEANRLRAPDEPPIDAVRLKVYVRHAGDLSAVRAEIARQSTGIESAVYLHADICRDDLLVEIEAYGCTARLDGG